MAALPVDRGGLGLANVGAHALAMQAKTAWLLFRHSAHPWLDLYSHEVAAACLPLPHSPPGVHCLVTAPGRVSLARLRTPLLRSAVPAFLRLGVTRIVAPADQSAWSVLQERTFHNAPVPDQPALVPDLVATPEARQWHRLSAVRSAHLARDALPPAVQADLDVVLSSLPAPWQAVVRSAAPPEVEWSALPSASGEGGALFAGPDPNTGAMSLWELWPSGRLHALPADTERPLGPGLPASVTLRPKPRTAWCRADYTFHAVQLQLPAAERQVLLEPWLVGVWCQLELDPTVWGIRLPHGPAVSLLELRVRDARQRFAHLARLDGLNSRTGSIPGYREEQAVWPRTWRMAPADPAPAPAPPPPLEHLGLEGLEERWRQSAAAAPPDAAGPEVVDWVPPGLSLEGAQPPRLHPLARAQERLDAVPAPPVLRLGFREAWQRLADPTLHRPYRVTCWRMLHGCLGCKAFLHHVRRHQGQGPVADAMCEAPPCSGHPVVETLSHAFLDCPAASPAIDWLVATWTQLSQIPVPRSARVLLADDLDAWPGHPTDAGSLAVWTRLRVAVLGAIWELRCARSSSGESFARQAVSLALQHLLGALQRDWGRTQGDVRHLDAGGFCMDWWRGVDTALSVDQFKQQWAHPPLLCQVVGQRPLLPGSADTRTLELLLRPGHPVPLPP